MSDYCCAMRAKFQVGVVAEDRSKPDPPDLVDFIDFDARRPDGKMQAKIRFCPFCGKPVGYQLRPQPRKHDSQSLTCWCKPELRQCCPEGLDLPQCPKTCWKCHGENLVEVYDEALPILIIHRGPDETE